MFVRLFDAKRQVLLIELIKKVKRNAVEPAA